MRKIQGDAQSIRSLLAGAKFAIDYYQREYRWESKQIAELIDDLAEKFLQSHDPGNERSAVEQYGHYFLGSIIISDKDGQKFIIDGQQRLTSVTLLLIHIYRNLDDGDQRTQLADLIFSTKFGRRSFNLDVPERARCMDALFTGHEFDDSDQPESVINILGRFQDIEDGFPEDLGGDALPFFTDWLIENVHFVEITAYSDSDAYTIFETMNDRGLSLTPTDMLKGYLLANITDASRRNAASRTWRDRVASLKKLSKDEDADAIKSWLRAQHAQTIRERKRGAEPRDFDRIGTEFHRWVRENAEKLALQTSADFGRFIEEDFDFYSRWYRKIRQASKAPTSGLERVHYNAQNKFTLQYPALLAPLRKTDSEEVVLRKLRIVATYIDILIARRIWNWKSTDYSTMQYAMFQLVIQKIRGASASTLATVLRSRLEAEEHTFATNDRFRLHGKNRRPIHLLLARITDFVGVGSGEPSKFSEYVSRRGTHGYEVEHIWANHPERHRDEFDHPNDFTEYRNRIGGLVLLPKNFNQSYGDKPYADKRDHYFSQNPLAKSLCQKAYEHNPGFRKFRDETGLTFRPHENFKKADLDARQELYRDIAEQIWDPGVLQREAEA